MKRFFLFAIFVGWFAPLWAFADGQVQDVVLTTQGGARCAIYVAPKVMAPDVDVPATATFNAKTAEAQRRLLRESVNDLALYLEKISGATIGIVQGLPEADNEFLPILIGEYGTAKFGSPTKTAPFKQGFRYVVTPHEVALYGESDESSSYAIYELLDRLGCRWYMPSELGEVVPSLSSIRLQQQDFSGAPGTISRSIWHSDEAIRRRNRLGGFRIEGDHVLEHYITAEQRRQHPEWRAVIGGKPHDVRLKWSHPEVPVAIADAIIAKLDRQYVPSVSLSPDDGAYFDESDDTKWDAGDWDPSMNQVSITDRYIRLCNLIAERVTEKYPDVRLGFLAYVQYTRPPVREKLHPNLVPLIAPITYCRAHAVTDTHICHSRPHMRAITEGWGKAAHQVAYYNYMYHLAEVSVPYPMIHQMKEELPLIYGNRVAFWQPETMPNFESALPGMWLTLRKSWNPQESSESILDEFFERFYGAAQKPMRLYWQIFDEAWTRTPEHAGMDAGYVRRFTPEVMKNARAAMNEALSTARPGAEFERVKMHDEALQQFERLMQMKWDLNEGRLHDLESQSDLWLSNQARLGDQYARQYAFTKAVWPQEHKTIASYYYNTLFGQHFAATGRMACEHTVISPPLRQWKYRQDKEKQGEDLGWQKVEFDDNAWAVTDVGIDSWMALGMESYFGAVWYRSRLKLADIPPGKKVFLWLPSEDGDISAFVNGVAIPYVNEKGETLPQFSGGFGKPISFDITASIKPRADNQLTIKATRTFFNELGTGGLMAPIFIYREK